MTNIPDDKNTKVFKHAKSSPEVAPHKSKWDSKKCKRNKGGEHDMVLIKDEVKTMYDYNVYRIPGFKVWERRPFTIHDREWRCSYCNKKEVSYTWSSERTYIGDWEQVRRVEDRKQP